MVDKTCTSLLLLLIAGSCCVSAFTNWELFSAVRPYLTDIDITDEYVALSDDVIDLGDADDEVDMDMVLQQLGLNYTMDGVPQNFLDQYASLAALHKLGGHHSEASCQCTHDQCNCCIKHKFSVKVIFKRIHFTFHACVDVGYLPANHQFFVKIEFQNKQVYHHTISLNHPPTMCYGVPGFKGYAKVCVQVYNIDLAKKSMCVKLTGTIDLKVHKFKIHLNLPCFHIPTMDEGTLYWVRDSPELLD